MNVAGQTSMREALIAAVAKNGKLDALIAELERRKRNRVRYRTKRLEKRRKALGNCRILQSFGGPTMLPAVRRRTS